MSAIAAAAPRSDHRARPQHAAAAEQRAERDQHGSQPRAVHDRRALLGALVLLGEALGEQARQGRVEHQPAVRRVVMGDHDDRLGAVRIARFAEHVEGVAVGQQCASKPQPPAADFIPDRRRRARPDRARQQPCPARARASGREPGERRAAVEQAQRPPVAAVSPLDLDLDRVSVIAHARSDPLCGASLALGRRRSLDARELAHDRLELPCEPRLGCGTRAVVCPDRSHAQTLSEVMRILTRGAIFSDAKAVFSISVENDDGD
jgi:hypothetical protein